MFFIIYLRSGVSNVYAGKPNLHRVSAYETAYKSPKGKSLVFIFKFDRAFSDAAKADLIVFPNNIN